MSRAVVVKYLPHTEHKPSRLKLCVKDCKSVTVSYWSVGNPCWTYAERAHKLAVDWLIKKQWVSNSADVSTAHTLPNGDLVFTIR